MNLCFFIEGSYYLLLGAIHMTQKIDLMDNLPTIKCPECEVELSKELRIILAHDISIICEQCGERIKQISDQFKRKILEIEKSTGYKFDLDELQSRNLSIIHSKDEKTKNRRVQSTLKRISEKLGYWVGNIFQYFLDSLKNWKTRFNLFRQGIKIKFRLLWRRKSKKKKNNKNNIKTLNRLEKEDMNETKSQNDIQENLGNIVHEHIDLKGRSEVFTVLEPNIRERLLALPITHYEQDIMAKSFIYMTLEQQRKYLTEIEQTDPSHSEIAKQLIEVIENLPIPLHQKKVLIDQLNYIPGKDHQEFIETLKQGEISAQETTTPQKNDQNEKEPETKPQRSIITENELKIKKKDKKSKNRRTPLLG